ncbi:MAG TPA: zinc ribbon domain-containing protein [Treponemataceae bacterium]|nr:zinc ribbon domain-containing protein [Treponemataceae bacterium]HPS44453.1 zinc ribbon domain-containing protein [Treponemataceae bacterium]
MKRLPAFFCEFCGTQVRQNDRVCPHCGKFFSSVKCPSCGFTGDSKIFRDGCPACGYAFGGHGDNASREGSAKRGASPRLKGKGETDPLPIWIYAVTLAVLALVVALILLRR